MKITGFFLFSILFLINILPLSGQNVKHPFPNHTRYAASYIQPANYTQDQLDRQTEAFYDAWKKKYLKVGCESNQYYVWFEDGNTMTVSEAMGYGMLITPLMAGYDPDAKKYFDGLNQFYLAHPSDIMPHLMAWKQITGCKDADGPDSATDGDVDIAFGLLLAYEQWGDVSYLQEALLIINDIMGKTPSEGDINQNYYSVKLGDWATGGMYINSTRTSDFIMDHFRIFGYAVHDTTSWNRVVDTCYALVKNMQTNYSPNTGLLPDFIIHLNKTPEPAYPNFLEGKLDGNYSYNACRDPWRLANDYLINGDKRAKKAVLKIDKWLYQSTGGSVNKVYAGYYLNGKKAAGWSDISFTAPFAVGAMLDTSNQLWLNKLYSRVLSSTVAGGGYYDNTLKLLALITISGNYWVPSKEIISGTASLKKNAITGFSIYPTNTSGTIKVKVDPMYRNKNYRIEIFNLMGKKLLQESLDSVLAKGIRIGNFPNGMYLVSLIGTETNVLCTRKIIKY